MRRFSLYRRREYHYARFWSPETRTYTGAISIRETEEEAAIAAAGDGRQSCLVELRHQIADIRRIRVLRDGGHREHYHCKQGYDCSHFTFLDHGIACLAFDLLRQLYSR